MAVYRLIIYEQAYNYNETYGARLSEEEYARRQLEEMYEIAVWVAVYQNEEAIRSGALIELEYDARGNLTGMWDVVTGNPLAENVFEEAYEAYYGSYWEDTFYAESGESEFPGLADGEEAPLEDVGEQTYESRARTEAIRQQLSHFASWKDSLQSSGLQYYISNNGNTFSNATRIQELRYHLTLSDGHASSNIDSLYLAAPAFYKGGALLSMNPYIQLGTDAAEHAIRVANLAVQRSVMKRFIVETALYGVLGIFSVLVLTMGAGRRMADGGQQVHLTLFDMIYLDVGLAAILFLTWIDVDGGGRIVLEWFEPINSAAWRVCLSVLIIAPVVLAFMWYMSFVKRVKDNTWWQHTLICRCMVWLRRLMQWILREIRRFFQRRYWSWGMLTHKGKLFLLMAIVCMALILSAIHPLFTFVMACGAGVCIYLHYKNLGILETGMQGIENGRYYDKVVISGGDFSRIAASVNNITAGLDQAVKQRMQSERLKTELITNVSHDLRTPLTSLVTYTDLLKTEGLDSPHAPEYLDVLIQKTQRLRVLTDELFEAAKASSGSIEVNWERLNLSDLLRQCLGEMDERVQASGLDFRMTLPDAAMVHGDGRLLYRVMENLLNNILRYALAGSRVYLDLGEEEGRCRLEIKNISAQPLNVPPQELTERFKRGDESRHSEGSGLGLSIAQSFTEAQNGVFKIYIDGDLFKVIILLPMAD